MKMCEPNHATVVDFGVQLVQSSKRYDFRHSDPVCAKQGGDAYLGEVQKASNITRSFWPRRIPPFLPLDGSENHYYRDHDKRTDDVHIEEDSRASSPARSRPHSQQRTPRWSTSVVSANDLLPALQQANTDFSALSRSIFPPSMEARRLMATRSSYFTRKKQSSLIIIDSVLFDILDANDDPSTELRKEGVCFSS